MNRKHDRMRTKWVMTECVNKEGRSMSNCQPPLPDQYDPRILLNSQPVIVTVIDLRSY